MNEIKPTPEQVEAAQSLIHSAAFSMDTVGALAAFLARRDAEKDAELRRQSQELERAREALEKSSDFLAAYMNMGGWSSDDKHQYWKIDHEEGKTLERISDELEALLAALAQPAPEKP